MIILIKNKKKKNHQNISKRQESKKILFLYVSVLRNKVYKLTLLTSFLTI